MQPESISTDIARKRTSGKASPGVRFDGVTSEEFGEFIEAHNWVFAKTMPQCPHEYLVRKGCRDDDEWRRAVRLIRVFGYDDYFFTKKIRYIDYRGRRYWTMGYEEKGEDILNRAWNKSEHTPRLWIRNTEVWVPLSCTADGYAEVAEPAGVKPYLSKEWAAKKKAGQI